MVPDQADDPRPDSRSPATSAGVEAEEMMYFEWIMAALGVIVVYMLLGYAWVWWTAQEWKPKK